jgi:hypothetical protein
LTLASIADRVRTESTVDVLREPAFRICHRMQDINPSDQIRALFLAALVTAEAAGLDPYEEIYRASRITRQAEGPMQHHVSAIRDYVAGELIHKDPT